MQMTNAGAKPWQYQYWPMDVATFFWALLEATLFLPPVEMLVSWLALDNPRRALRASAFALFGASGGVTILYLWGGYDPFTAMTVLSSLPGLSPEIMIQAEEAMMQHGAFAIVGGVFSSGGGRAHAIFAQALGVSPPTLIGIHAAARAGRLLLAGCLAFCLGALLQRLLPHRMVVALWAVAWGGLLWLLHAPAGIPDTMP